MRIKKHAHTYRIESEQFEDDIFYSHVVTIRWNGTKYAEYVTTTEKSVPYSVLRELVQLKHDMIDAFNHSDNIDWIKTQPGGIDYNKT